jgi:hypothetical protein
MVVSKQVRVMLLLSAQMMTWMMMTLTWPKEQQLVGKRPTVAKALTLVEMETLQPQQLRSLSDLLQQVGPTLSVSVLLRTPGCQDRFSEAWGI